MNIRISFQVSKHTQTHTHILSLPLTPPYIYFFFPFFPLPQTVGIVIHYLFNGINKQRGIYSIESIDLFGKNGYF